MRKIKYSILLFLLISCTTPNTLIIEVPHNYEGNIFIVYNIQDERAGKLSRRGNFLFCIVNSPPVKFIKDELTENLIKMRLGIVDAKTQLKINREENEEIGKRVFENKINEISIEGISYKYFSAFITNEIYKSDSKKLDSLMFSKKNQITILKADIFSLSKH